MPNAADIATKMIDYGIHPSSAEVVADTVTRLLGDDWIVMPEAIGQPIFWAAALHLAACGTCSTCDQLRALIPDALEV